MALTFSGCKDRAANESGGARAAAPGSPNKSPARPPVPVTVATVQQKDVPLFVSAIGTAEAFASIQVKSMVPGQITKVHFQEGQDVKKGDALFTIDQAPFEAARRQAEASLNKNLASIKEAEANLARDLTQAKTAKVQAERYSKLVNEGVVSKDEYDRVRTTAEASQATVEADRAAIENAKAAAQVDRAALENADILVGYTTIRAPIDGRTGNLDVDEGNLVKANETPALVTINQVAPLNVTFSVPGQQLPAIKNYQSQHPLQVTAFPPANPDQAERGTLTFIDNAVDVQTDTIKLKGTFSNETHRLWPGQFVKVTMTLSTQKDAIVIPSQAVQSGQQGEYVFVVKPDQTVESRPVKVDRSLDGLLIIAQGLAPGEAVVTDGQLQLTPGTRVITRGPAADRDGATSTTSSHVEAQGPRP